MNKLKSILNSPKRIVSFIVVVILILAVLAFVGIKAGASVLNNQGIGLEKATAVALQNAGYEESEASLIRGHYDHDDGLGVYEIEFKAGDYNYDYVISAKDGTIIEVDREYVGIPQSTTPETPYVPEDNQNNNGSSSVAPDDSNYIGADKAKEIALQNAGVDVSSATFTKAKLDRDDGIYVYDIEFVSGDMEYSYEISATDGSIVDKDFESIYD